MKSRSKTISTRKLLVVQFLLRAPASPMSNCWAWGVQQRLAASDCAEHVTALARCCREVGDGWEDSFFFLGDQVAFFVIKNDQDISKWFNMDMEFQAPTFPWRVWCFGARSRISSSSDTVQGFCLGRPTWIVGRSWTPGARWTRKAGQQCLRGLRGTPVPFALCGVEGDAPCDLELDVVRPAEWWNQAAICLQKTSCKGVELLMI